jgi:hypothetical protein
MDNCSTHHSSTVTELCRLAGVYLLYLPPYSPHLNRIEQTFHLLKCWLRKWRDLAPKFEEYVGQSDAYKDAWIARLQGAVGSVLSTVDVRHLFQRSKVRWNSGD